MAGSERTLRIVIEGNDKSGSKALKGLNKDLKGLAVTAGAVGGALVAFGYTAKKVFDFGREGAEMMRLEQAGESLAAGFGTSMGAIVSAVKDASFGTISEMDIIASANKAMMLGVAKDAETMADLMQVAMARGRAMGLSTQQAFGDLVTGLGRASPMILDNLGIVLDAEDTYRRYALSVGKAATELSKAEKIQALTADAIAEGSKMIDEQGGLARDAAGDIEAMEAAWTDMAATLKKAVAPAVVSVANAITETINALDQEIEIYHELAQARDAGIITAYEYLELESKLSEQMLDNAGVLDILAQKTQEQAFARGYAVMAMSEEEQALYALATANTQWSEKLAEATEGTEEFSEDLSAAAQSGGHLADSLFNAKTAVIGYDASIRAAASAGALLEDANRGISSSISSLMADIDFFKAGGMEVQLQFEQVKAAILSNAITPEEGKSLLENLYVQAQGIEVEIGEIDFSQAAQNISEELEIPLEDANEALNNLTEDASAFDITQPFKDALEPSEELREVFEKTGDDVQELIDLDVAAYMEGWGNAMSTATLPPLTEAVTQSGLLGDNIAALEDKTITVTTIFKTVGEGGIGSRQAGGVMHAGRPYKINEPGVGSEWFIPARDGFMLNRQQAERAMQGGGSAGTVINMTNHFTVDTELDIEEITWRIARRIQERIE